MTTVSPEADWKRLRKFAFVQVSLIVASAGVLVWIWFGVRSLEIRRDMAAQQLRDKEQQLIVAKEQLSATEEQLLAGDQQLRVSSDALETSRRELSKVQSQLKALETKPANELRASITATLKATEHAETIVRNATPKKPRIHILYAGEGQRAAATRLETTLRAAEYTVREPTNIAGTQGRPASDMTQVRFMHPQDRASALEVLSLLRTSGIEHSRISYVPDQPTPEGRIEIWFEAGEIR